MARSTSPNNSRSWRGLQSTRAKADRITEDASASGDQAAAMGNHAAAVKHYTAALAVRTDLELLAKRSRSFTALRDHKGAVCDHSLAIRLAPNDWSHRANRAAAFQEPMPRSANQLVAGEQHVMVDAGSRGY